MGEVETELALTPPQLAAVMAAIDRIIPEDDFPSASQAGVDRFLLRLLAGDGRRDAEAIRAGLDALNGQARGDFAGLEISAQDALLAAFEHHAEPQIREFFRRLVEMTQEGYYADPENGGNRRAASWKMVGYDPRVPGYMPWDAE
jgi:hypothetical protein